MVLSLTRRGTIVTPRSICTCPLCTALRTSSMRSADKYESTLTCPSKRPVLARMTRSLSSSIIAKKLSTAWFRTIPPSGSSARNEFAAPRRPETCSRMPCKRSARNSNLVHVGSDVENVAKPLSTLVQELNHIRRLQTNLGPQQQFVRAFALVVVPLDIEPAQKRARWLLARVARLQDD